MIDNKVKFFDLFMLHSDLASVAEIKLPTGYSFRFFNGSNQDIQHWKDIEVSSGDVKDYEAAQEGFDTYYGDYQQELLNRCIFILNDKGTPVGTATAFFVVKNQPGLPKISESPLTLPKAATGHLHWVAIKKEYQGKGLSKPLISYTMNHMARLGHTAGFLHTQTPSYLACKIYLDLGWKPFRFVQSMSDFTEGWGIVQEKVKELKKNS